MWAVEYVAVICLGEYNFVNHIFVFCENMILSPVGGEA